MTRRAASSIFLIGGEAQAVAYPGKDNSTICSINQIPPSTHIVMDGSADSIAEQTLFALETRLRRIEFVLAGSSEDPVGDLYARRKSGKESSVKSRLNTLERDLSRLAIKSRTVKDMLDLRLFPSPTHLFPNASSSALTNLLRCPFRHQLSRNIQERLSSNANLQPLLRRKAVHRLICCSVFPCYLITIDLHHGHAHPESLSICRPYLSCATDKQGRGCPAGPSQGDR